MEQEFTIPVWVLQELQQAAEKVARQLEAHDSVYVDDFENLKSWVDVYQEIRFPEKTTPRYSKKKSPEELSLWVKNTFS